MNKSVELGLYFVPQSILKDSSPYIHRIWQGYNVFYFNVQEKCWYYWLNKNFNVRKSNEKDGFVVIHLPKIKKINNNKINKVTLKVSINNLFTAYSDNEDKKEIKEITNITRTEAIDSLTKDITPTKLQALSLCISAFPANLVIESHLKQITENSIIESLSPLDIDEYISDICNDYGYLLGWINQQLLGEQYVKTNLDAVDDANFVVEMLSKIDITALYKELGFYKEDTDDEK